ncbi:MAG: hypothetical protein MI743_05470 [Sneathiellales bacterium]|nr:hypothetical protein [Sneathiellales bacterium]
MTVPVCYDDILAVFFSLLEEEEHLIEQMMISGDPIEVLDKEWHFSLPALFNVLCTTYSHFSSLNYTEFEKLVFGCPVNAFLNDAGWQLRILKRAEVRSCHIYSLERVSGT